MAHRYTDALIAARTEAFNDGLFQWRPNSYSAKIECVSCGDNGYSGGSWMDAHIEGHRVCACGKVTTNKSFKRHANRCAIHLKRDGATT
jgi:hypothetical protein